MWMAITVLGPALIARWFYQQELSYELTGQIPTYAKSHWTYTNEAAENQNDVANIRWPSRSA